MSSRDTLRIIHAASGSIGLATILGFMVSTVAVEAMGEPAAIAAVKQGIVWGLLVLVPALAAAGATGARLAGGMKGRKAARMKIIAPNGLLVLVPAALFLADRAAAGVFDGWFYTVQAIELVAGAVNIALLSLNLRDGLAMRRRRVA